MTPSYWTFRNGLGEVRYQPIIINDDGTTLDGYYDMFGSGLTFLTIDRFHIGKYLVKSPNQAMRLAERHIKRIMSNEWIQVNNE